MASPKQIKYAQDLLRQQGAIVEEYPMDKYVPGPLVGTIIDSILKDKIVPDKHEWQKTVAPFMRDSEGTGPDVFTVEMTYIRNLGLRDVVRKMLETCPKYFYEVPASSTGKHHPDYALGRGGLLRHTKAAVKIAVSLLENPGLHEFTAGERDIIIAALILHDTVKHGFVESQYSVLDHPLLVERLFKPEWVDNSGDSNVVLEGLIKTMFSCIRSHMGPWTKDRYGREILPKPESEIERFVHLCDYLASRKFLEVLF